jgi:predicted amidohydrolase
MKITILQTNLIWENKTGNLSQLEEKISNLNDDTDLIVLPEMFSTGFTMNAKSLAESMTGNTIQWMQKIANEKNCAITGSIIIEENEKHFNRLFWITPEENKSYDKRHLFSYAKEDITYTAGTKKLIVEYKGWKICPLICYDLRFPVWSRRTKQDDYDLLLYVANWPERRNFAWKTLLPARAIENQSYVVGVNRIGNDGNDIYHSGDSAVYNFTGEKISKTQAHEESVETVKLDLEALREHRRHFAFGQDADSFSINH